MSNPNFNAIAKLLSQHQQLLDFEPSRAHARKTDPYTSDKALKAIAHDGTLMGWIWHLAVVYRDEYHQFFNDSILTWEIEDRSGKRQQRNVIARSRGLLEDAGMLRQVGVRRWWDQDLMHYEIDPNNKKENPNG